MSLTSHIKNKSPIYYSFRKVLHNERCRKIIHEHNDLMGTPELVPENFSQINFPFLGTAVIYAVREYFFEKTFWKQTIPYRHLQATCPTSEIPYRWFEMALLESECRGSLSASMEDVNLTMVDDILNIIRTFPIVLGKARQYLDTTYHVNPNFVYSSAVGGADANMIIGDTLWDIRTTLKRTPFSYDNIVQQIAYVILGAHEDFGVNQICWYYPRQMKTFTYPISDFFIDDIKAQIDGIQSIITDSDYLLDLTPNAHF